MKKLLAFFCIIPILVSCSTTKITDPNIAMMINESSISMDEYIYNFEYITKSFTAETGQSADSISAGDLKAIKANVQNQILFLFTVKRLATENNIALTEADNKYIKDKTDEEIQQFGGVAAFNTALESLGLTPEKYKEINESGVLHAKLATFYFGSDSQNPITEDSVKKSFANDYYHIKRLVINKPESGNSADDGHAHTDFKTPEEAKTLIQDIQTKIRASDDFDSLITEFSQDPELAQNPNGYYLKKGSTIPEIEKASLALKENEISEIIETESAYHIIKRLPLDENYFTENKEALIEQATDDAITKLINDTIAGYKITLNDIIKDITPANASSYINK